MSFKCLFFDLDGTLIDSREDLADAVNFALAEMKLETLPNTMIADFIGEGVFNLIIRSLTASLGKTPDEAAAQRGVEIFRQFYGENCLRKTALYTGVAETLEKLGHFKKAVITNKPRDFSVRILKGLGILRHFDFVAGGDSFPERKPSPLPLLSAIEKLGCSAAESLMIGDSRVDIEAGKNAGIKTCGCVFGFRGREELETAGADFLIENFADLAKIL